MEPAQPRFCPSSQRLARPSALLGGAAPLDAHLGKVFGDAMSFSMAYF